MSWLKENPLLSAFLGFVMVAAVGLIVLTLGAKGSFDEVSQTYDSQATELGALQRKEPYPDKDNLQAMEEAREEYRASVAHLQATLSKIEFETPQLSPEEFQKTLSASVTTVGEKARQNGVNMPATFYLGFDPYQSQLPSKELAPELARQLHAIQFVVAALLDNKPVSLDELSRLPLPLETGIKAPAAAGREQKPPSGEGDGTSVQHHPFSFTATIDPIRLRRFLNEISSTPKQFFIVRNVQIENLSPKSPSRVPGGAPPVSDVPPEGQEGAEQPAAPTAGKREYLFGTEKVVAKVELEIADFPEPTPKP